MRNKPFATFKATFAVPKQTMINTVKRILNRPFYYGKFQLLNRDILFEVQEKFKKGEKLPFFDIPDTTKISEYEIIYLDKIVNLCNRRNIKLVLVNIPKRIGCNSFGSGKVTRSIANFTKGGYKLAIFVEYLNSEIHGIYHIYQA